LHREQQAPPVLSRRLLFCIALAVGAAVANLYYSQPMLGLIGVGLGEPDRVALIAMSTQIGYAAGLLLLVPLGDTLERRRLIVVQCLLLFAAITACALAPTLAALAFASFLVGVFATIAQLLIPLAADLAQESRRTHAIGAVYVGSLVGILLARAVSGIVSQALGWRAMFWIAAALMLMTAAMLAWTLPRLSPRSILSYGRLLGSLWHAFMRYPALRKVCAVQACVFGAFSVFWSVFALMLQGPPHHLGAAAAGAFGVIGLVGMVAVGVRARWVNHHGLRHSVPLGSACCALSFVVFAWAPGLAGIAAGIALLDIGVSLCQVSGQSLILGLEDGARSRINTVFMTASFAGGALGSGVASLAWQQGGWLAVSGAGFGLSVAALAIHVLAGRKITDS